MKFKTKNGDDRRECRFPLLLQTLFFPHRKGKFVFQNIEKDTLPTQRGILKTKREEFLCPAAG